MTVSNILNFYEKLAVGKKMIKKQGKISVKMIKKQGYTIDHFHEFMHNIEYQRFMLNKIFIV